LEGAEDLQAAEPAAGEVRGIPQGCCEHPRFGTAVLPLALGRSAQGDADVLRC
jgi:hypothetical protein